MYRYSLEINTRPIPKQRPRLSKFAVYTPKKTRDYENLIAFEWKKKYKNLILKGALKIDLLFCFKKAKTCKKKYHTQRPDIDNLIKSVLDGLNEMAFLDDSQIVKLNLEKVFAEYDKVIINITELE